MNSKKLLIWLVDDDRDDRFLFKYTIEELQENVEVVTINSCDEFIRQLYFRQGALPDIVFLDLNMPRRSGIECLFELKKEAEFKGIRVVIYSTSANPSDITKAYKNGADLYVQKPFDIDHLSKVLRKIIDACRRNEIGQPDESEFFWGA